MFEYAFLILVIAILFVTFLDHTVINILSLIGGYNASAMMVACLGCQHTTLQLISSVWFAVGYTMCMGVLYSFFTRQGITILSLHSLWNAFKK